MLMPTLFGEQHIQITGNKLLESICNHILDLVQRQPDLIKGKSIGEINRKVLRAIWEDEGIKQVLNNEQLERFFEWYDKAKSRIESDAVTRALRELRERDAIRLPEEAVINGEHHRQHIQRSLRKNALS